MRLFAIILALISSPAVAQYYDGGGTFAERNAQIAIERAQPRVVLPMQCDSACIMQLVLPQACIQHGSSFGVHAAYGPTGAPNEAATQYAFRYYRLYPKFQAAIRARHAMGTFQKTIFTDVEMHSYGVRYCE